MHKVYVQLCVGFLLYDFVGLSRYPDEMSGDGIRGISDLNIDTSDLPLIRHERFSLIRGYGCGEIGFIDGNGVTGCSFLIFEEMF